MFTTATLLGSLRPSLSWARVRMATSRHFQGLMRVIAVEPCRVPAPVPIPVPRRPRAVAAALALMAAIGVAPVASQAAPTRFETTADGRLVDVQVRVDGMGTVPLYFAPGRHDRHYFQAFRGHNYSLVVRNTTGRRVGVLIAVDGLNVVNGERSSLSRHESMYVLDPYESATIRGWRTSLQNVRRFVFVDEHRSYAERTGQANGDMGWIRVLAFREQRPFWDMRGKVRDRYDDGDEVVPYGAVPELEKRQAAPGEQPETLEGLDRAPSPSRSYAERENSNPGTGWGQSSHDPVNRTHFAAEASPVDHLVLRYEYAKGLRALGIRIWNGRDRLWERERGQLGFAQPPKW